MVTEPKVAETYLDAAAALLDLPILPEHRAEVVTAFLTLDAQAELLAAFSLPEDAQAAPRFLP